MSQVTFHSRAEAAAELKRLARNAATVLYTNLTAPLRRAVLVHWGSMTAARKALGLTRPPAPRQIWTRQRVLDEIARLHRSGVHMSTVGVVGAGRQDLLVAANTYVGSWTRARTLAGVGFEAKRVASTPIWDAATVISEIKHRRAEGLPLAVSKAPKSLTCAGNRIFGSWRDAVTAAGFDYDTILLRREYDDDELLTWLRQLARRKPRMTLFDLDKHGEHAVICRRRWGSYEDAAKAAGLDDWPLRERAPAMPRNEVLRELRKLHKAKRDLAFSAVREQAGGHFLINSVSHHFKSWDQAVRAAGLSVQRRRSSPSASKELKSTRR